MPIFATSVMVYVRGDDEAYLEQMGIFMWFSVYLSKQSGLSYLFTKQSQ